MPRQDQENLVTQSLLDKLIDLEPRVPADGPTSRAVSVRQLKASLRRDLEWLLNTRRTPDPAPESSVELQKSLFNYGLPDLTTFNVKSVHDQHRLVWLLESTVANFEPRLDAVKVSMEPITDATRMIRFQIEGMLKMEPAPERVAFDTILELTSGIYQIRGDAGAR